MIVIAFQLGIDYDENDSNIHKRNATKINHLRKLVSIKLKHLSVLKYYHNKTLCQLPNAEKNLRNIQGKNAFVTVKKASLDILPRDKICNVHSALQGTEMECLFQLKIFQETVQILL